MTEVNMWKLFAKTEGNYNYNSCCLKHRMLRKWFGKMSLSCNVKGSKHATLANMLGCDISKCKNHISHFFLTGKLKHPCNFFYNLKCLSRKVYYYHYIFYYISCKLYGIIIKIFIAVVIMSKLFKVFARNLKLNILKWVFCVLSCHYIVNVEKFPILIPHFQS